MSHTSEINLKVSLDENKVPEKITWNASDGGVDAQETKAIMLSVWEEKRQELLKIDLWTKDLPMDDMKKFVHQNLLSLAAVIERATNEEHIANDMRQFAQYFGEKMDLFPKSN